MGDLGTSAFLLPLLSKIGGSAVEAAFAPSPYQPRQSFRGTAADPVSMLSGATNTLRSILNNQINTVNQGVSLPDAKVGTLPTFTGGGMPMPIGVVGADRSGQSNLMSGFGLPGLTGDASGGTNVDLPFAGPHSDNPNDQPTVGKAVPRVPGSTPTVPSGGDTSNGGRGAPRTASAGLRSIYDNGPTAAAPRAADLLDDQTKGALQLLFHAVMPDPLGYNADMTGSAGAAYA